MKTRGTISEAKAGQGKGRTEQGERVSTEADMESATGKRGFAVMEGDPAGDACLVGRPETKHEQGGGRFPAALRVALDQTSEGKWYTSTLKLQLTSFAACAACRGVRTLRVAVTERMPLSLWGDDDSSSAPLTGTGIATVKQRKSPRLNRRGEHSLGDSLNAPEKRRLPALRAAGARWKLPAGMLVPVLSESVLLKEVRWMQVIGVDCGRSTNHSCRESLWMRGSRRARSPRGYFEEMITYIPTDALAVDTFEHSGSIYWPSALKELSLGLFQNKPIDWVALPSSLERLALEGVFDQPVEAVTWPDSLKQLTLGGWFDRPINDMAWPSSLLKLTFGDEFNQPIGDVVWPVFLVELTFRDTFDKPITDVAWPVSLLQLSLGDAFNQPIDSVTWPPSLLQLSLGNAFNKPITGVAWPASLERLTFGKWFNQPITGVAWPALLTQLTFGNVFKQTIAGVVWPASLKYLTFDDRTEHAHFGDGSHQPIIDDVVWPASLLELDLGAYCHRIAGVEWPSFLKRLVFGSTFDQSIAGVAWPASLLQLTLGRCFNQPITEVVWPASLSLLDFGSKFNQAITGVKWPAVLLDLTFGNRFNQPITDVVWPTSLKTLAFGNGFNRPIDGVVWPEYLNRLAFGDSFNQSITEVVWPASLNQLVFGGQFDHPLAKVVWPEGLQTLEFGTAFCLNPLIKEGMYPPSLKRLTFPLPSRKATFVVPLPISVEPLTGRLAGFIEPADQMGCPPGRDAFDLPKTELIKI